jgi:hypothetical protein
MTRYSKNTSYLSVIFCKYPGASNYTNSSYLTFLMTSSRESICDCRDSMLKSYDVICRGNLLNIHHSMESKTYDEADKMEATIHHHHSQPTSPGRNTIHTGLNKVSRYFENKVAETNTQQLRNYNDEWSHGPYRLSLLAQRAIAAAQVN